MVGDKSKIRLLEKEGWTMRFAAGEPRLSEAAEMYRDSGFEVLLEPMPKGTPRCDDCAGEETGGECRVCFNGFEDQYRIIFTRPLKDGTKKDEDLF
jgi:hypothetical protein